jgi:hypothetical protein
MARIIPIAMDNDSFYMLYVEPSRELYVEPSRESRIMKLALIALGLLATTGVVYAACVLC